MGSSQTKNSRNKRRPASIAPFASKKTVNVVIETPKGRRNKYRFDEKLGVFRLGKVLPAGSAFPYDFGFIPGTRAEDGDPLDVLVLMDESAYPGCLIEARLIGVIEADQIEDGKGTRNDRLVAVAKEAHDYHDVRSLSDINPELLRELEHFFQSYNQINGVEFRLIASRGPRRAKTVVMERIESRSRRSRIRKQPK